MRLRLFSFVASKWRSYQRALRGEIYPCKRSVGLTTSFKKGTDASRFLASHLTILGEHGTTILGNAFSRLLVAKTSVSQLFGSESAALSKQQEIYGATSLSAPTPELIWGRI